MLTQAQVETIVARSSGSATGFMVPDCGHIPHHQQRRAVLEAITRFLSRLPGLPGLPGPDGR